MSVNSRSKKEQADLKRFLTEMQSEKQLLRDHLRARHAEVDSKNAILDQAISQLENLLEGALSVDAFIDLDSSMIQARLPSFKRKKPVLRRYLPAPLSGIDNLLPWKKRSYEKACVSAERKYKQDCEAYREAIFHHQKQVSQIRAEAENHNQEIERFQQDFAAGEAEAVTRYFNLVLTNSEYPAGFPKRAELAYSPESRLLKISYDLPALDIIPETRAYKYAESRDEITESVRPQKQRRQFYTSVLAQTSLRTIYEIFTADQTEKIEHIVFHGYVDAINPGTGQPGRFCLVALTVRREHFLNLNLKQVEPVACLRGLNAAFSPKPDQLLPVSPRLGEESGDAQESAAPHAASLRALNTRIGELENQIQKHKNRNAELENELSDKRDRIAELVRDLREEQEQSAALNVVIQEQKVQIAQLDVEPHEKPGDARIGELENAIQEQRNRNADLENELLDKRDRIAELIRDLREEQERTADLSAVIHAQNDDVVELEVKPGEEPGDTKPAKAITAIAEDNAIVEAGIFTPITSGNSEEDPGGARIPPREAEADKPVTLRSLLVGPKNSEGGDERDENTAEEAVRARDNGAEITTAAPGFLQRPENTPEELLTDLEVVAHIMGTNDSETSQLLAQMMKHDWQCPPSVLDSAFEGQFVNLIFEEINERAHDNIDENVIFDEDGQWVIHEDYRDEIEYIITHKEYLESKNAQS